MFAFLLCSFSIFCEAVISVATAFNGFCCGCVLFYSVKNVSHTDNLYVFLFFYILACAVTIIFSSVCIGAHRILFLKTKNTAKTVISLLFAFLVFGGAACILKLIELLLL